MKKYFRNLFATAALVFTTLSFVAPVSCRLTDEGIEIMEKDTTSPSIVDFSVTDEKSIMIKCSEQVVLTDAKVFQAEDFEEFEENEEAEIFASATPVSYGYDGKSVAVKLSSSTEIGKKYVFSGKIFDASGNSLGFEQEFFGFNACPARLIFSEIRNNYDYTKEKTEFVEFFVVKGGNLSGLEFFAASKNEKKKYGFPPIDVKAGDFVTLHLQTIITKKNNPDKHIEKAFDETSGDKNLSKSLESSEKAWDFWLSGSDKIISGKDILILRDSCSKKVKDIVLLTNKKDNATPWSKKLSEYAKMAQESEIWSEGCDISTSIVLNSTTKSVSRTDLKALVEKYSESEDIPEFIPNSKENWTIASPTPGF